MTLSSELVRVRGQVQGVGFRPAVSRLAEQLGIAGWVKNDDDGVLIALAGDAPLRERFVEALLAQLPPLASVQEIVRASREPMTPPLPAQGFAILHSTQRSTPHAPRACVVPDAAPCAACSAEVLDPQARRYRYPFSNCTACGPRFSIAYALPWDRAHTSLAGFDLCSACREEYEDTRDRRYHAEPIACPACGPRVQLRRSAGTSSAHDGASHQDPVAAVASLLQGGAIVALKGIGGFQLLADATQEAVVERLRRLKRRPDKPFALMARDVAQVSTYCWLSEAERAALQHVSNPIVVLQARDSPRQPGLAPSLCRTPPLAAKHYGFMLPSSPLHALALQRMASPVVCTSGNRSEEPQVITDDDAVVQLAELADWILGHDRPIHNRVDDSVVRVFGGHTRTLRRARGLAPAPCALPPGFEASAARESVWAAGTEQKAALCLSRQDDLVLSQHLGDLSDARTECAYLEQGARLQKLFEHQPTCVAADNHPDDRAALHARAIAEANGLPFYSVPHHHAHFAACLGENQLPLDGPDIFGLVLDGVGTGDDGRSLWGAELLLGRYRTCARVGSLEPTPLLGGDRAAREPWRCLYAQLRAAMPWPDWQARFASVPSVQRLAEKPLAILEQLIAREIAAPCASSCGRLFDAAAAALGLCFAGQSYEAQAAQALEALVVPEALARALSDQRRGLGYTLVVARDGRGLLRLDPRTLWEQMLTDLSQGVPQTVLAARFHVALAAGFAQLCSQAHEARPTPGPRIVAVSGGCLQNAVLFERLNAELSEQGFEVLSHAQVPAHDGGIALGQALITLARSAALQNTMMTEC